MELIDDFYDFVRLSKSMHGITLRSYLVCAEVHLLYLSESTVKKYSALHNMKLALQDYVHGKTQFLC